MAAVLEDGADTVIIGCTLAAGAERRLIGHLRQLGPVVKVIEPLRWSVAYAYAAATNTATPPSDRS